MHIAKYLSGKTLCGRPTINTELNEFDYQAEVAEHGDEEDNHFHCQRCLTAYLKAEQAAQDEEDKFIADAFFDGIDTY